MTQLIVKYFILFREIFENKSILHDNDKVKKVFSKGNLYDINTNKIIGEIIIEYNKTNSNFFVTGFQKLVDLNLSFSFIATSDLETKDFESTTVIVTPMSIDPNNIYKEKSSKLSGYKCGDKFIFELTLS
jgi:hypothetical protein